MHYQNPAPPPRIVHSPTVAPPRARRTRVRLVCVGLGGSLMLGALACAPLTNPTATADMQQAVLDLQDLLVQMQEETTQLQWQVDSLQGVVARQDSSLRRLANLLGMPLSP